MEVSGWFVVVVTKLCAESEEQRFVGSMLLEPRSLFLMTDEAYVNMLHGIKEVTEDYVDDRVFNGQKHYGETLIRGTRISVTIRHVPVVTKWSVSNLISNSAR
ncbi:hypothetical protein KIN20_034940 [Parelaphostrongylus tenuis]|uniref:Alpha-ketoglutarate-dependent dioxygenase AlkB-like domain-containing protein n=1 Tax=Parelaphostrongylus tenuis TaxID=148309 RepID=A0AAD5RAS4_PARTN|nr:hypothetical protein KIN20_034940 [Parelaphostrongylus tenuis]